MSTRKTPEQYADEVFEKNDHVASGQLELTEPFFSRMCDKVGVHCNACGATYETTASSLTQGSNCRCCCKDLPGDDESFRKRLRASNPRYAAGLFSLKSEYAPRCKVECRCEICGHEWTATGPQLLSGAGCPRCGRGSCTSRTQEFITLGLGEVLGKDKVVSRDRETIGLELDVRIPGASLAIEVGALHWHPEPAAEVASKRALCAAKGMRLVGFFEGTHAEPRPTGLPFDWGWHSGDLFDEPGRETLIAFVCACADMAGHPVDFSEVDWDEVAIEAVKRAMPADTEKFIEKLRRRNRAFAAGEFDLKSDYCGDKGPIACHCNICDEDWSTTAGALSQSCSCPNYREHPGWKGSNTLTHEEFTERLKEKHPLFADGTYEVVGTYKTRLTPIKCHCNRCGSDWEMTPRSLLQNGGCRNCGRKERGKARRKTNEDFLAQVDRVNRHYDHGRGFEILSEYTGDRERVHCRCLACGHVWHPQATSLVHKSGPSGCPVCARERARLARQKKRAQG